jgi:DNA repair photolyase
MKYERIKAKSLLSKKIQADGWFHINRSLNAYRGCEHGCVYCDGMSEYYHVDNFTTHIRAKENAPDVLRKELKKEGYISKSELESETLWSFLDKEDAARLAMKAPRKQVIGVCGGVSDGFQPYEEDCKITQRIMETLRDFNMPLSILTKSDLVLRDLDLIKEIHQNTNANVMFTITLHDDDIQKVFEPKASSTSDRFDALKQFRKAGVPGGVMATPIIPTIGDNDENLKELAKKAKKAGAEFILFGGMTLKPGRQKEYFFNVIRRRYPENLVAIKRIYANNNKYGSPIWKEVPVNAMLRGHKICKEIGISDRSVRHRLPGEPEANHKILSLLLDMHFYESYLLGRRSSSTATFQELAKSLERGMQDLAELHKSDELEGALRAFPGTFGSVVEILEKGTCTRFEELLAFIDNIDS